jgi:hypothetical protein
MRFVLAVTISLLFPVLSAAQTSLQPGARVRVTSPSHDLRKHVMQVTEVRGDSLIVESATFDGPIAVRDITSIEVNVGIRNHFTRDALIGFGVGALLGAAIGAGAHDACSGEDGCLIPVSRGASAGTAAAAVGAVGFVVGGIFGLFDITEDWERLPMPARASIGQTPSGGIKLSFSRAF